MKNFSLSGGPNGGQAPDPSAFGFKWPALQKALVKRAETHADYREAGFELAQAEGVLRQLERQEVDVLASAMHRGEEPPDTATEISKAREEVERIKKKRDVLARVRQKMDAEVNAIVEQHREEWAEQVRQRAQEAASEVAEAVNRVRDSQTNLSALVALMSYLDNPSKDFSYGGGPANLSTFGGRVNVGEVLDGLIREAELAAIPAEKRHQMELRKAGIITTTDGASVRLGE